MKDPNVFHKTCLLRGWTTCNPQTCLALMVSVPALSDACRHSAVQYSQCAPNSTLQFNELRFLSPILLLPFVRARKRLSSLPNPEPTMGNLRDCPQEALKQKLQSLQCSCQYKGILPRHITWVINNAVISITIRECCPIYEPFGCDKQLRHVEAAYLSMEMQG
jgi:hypothetical protein